MPIYEYICARCGERFSLLQGVTSNQRETACTKCGSAEVKKVMSSFCCSTDASQGISSSSSKGFSGGG